MFFRTTQKVRVLLLLGSLCICGDFTAADDPVIPANNGVTFSHVYKIDLPKASDCKVEMDTIPVQDQGTEQAVSSQGMEGDNNIVFRHNIRLQTPKCDCESSESFQALLYRINGLEEEVTYLKSQCTQGCCGGGGSDIKCSGHGSLKQDTCSCVCDEGWEGEDCSRRSCPNECSDNGRCVDGQCVCYQGYAGADCSELLCPNDCNDKGRCVDGVCQCFRNFMGEDCSLWRCPNDCSGNGECDDGTCICEDGFTGIDCSKVMGPNNLRLLRSSEESLLVEWDEVPGAEYYLLTYHPEGDEGSIREIRVPSDTNSYLITGLTPGVKYIINVSAWIKGITSEPESLEATTEVSTVQKIRVVSQTEDSIQVEWPNPSSEVDYFRLTFVTPEGQEQEVRVQKSSGAKTSYTITDLFPGTKYLIKVQAIKGNTAGKPSSVNGLTDIDAPTNLVTKSVTEDTATLSWTSYKLTGLRPGVEYTVYIWAVKGDRKSKRTSTQSVTDIDAPTNLVTKSVTEDTATLSWDRSYKLTGLRPGVEYTVYIWAVKGDRKSKRTSTQAVTEIDAPTNLKVEDVQLNSGVLTWTPPLAVIDGYTLSYKAEDGSGQITERRVGPGERRFTLDGLELGKKYIVSLVAFRRNQRSRTVETTFTTVGVLFPFPMDCKEVLQSGNNSDGVYTIYLNNDRSKPMEVYCDMTTDGGGWIVLQRRNSGKLDFLKRWKQYIQGFGNLTDEFWLGLEKIYELTNTNTQYELRVDLKAGSESVYAVYDNFKIAPVRQKFKLTIGNYRGTAGDAMTYHQGRPFSTIDQDNDIALSNCALTHRGAWWYKNCHLANLNGRYGDDTHSVGVNWEPWKGHEFSIPFAEMKIRPHVASDTPVLGRKKRSLGGRGKSRRLESK
nr:PREDICTED: tenascin-N [Lepisosteus oculatus]